MDLKYTSSFDLDIGSDLNIADKVEFDTQLMQIKLRGTNPDFVLSPNLCCSYEDFAGMNNDESTGDLILQRTKSRLLDGNVLDSSRLHVDLELTDYSQINVTVTYTEFDGGYIETIYENREVDL